jgi:hypothetical protein
MLVVTDFKGLYNLSRNKFTKEDLEDDILRYEPLYLCYLLGKELADLYLADLVNGVPQTQRFIDIHNTLCLNEDTCFCAGHSHLDSLGIKEYLLGVVYYYHVVTYQNRHTMSGMVQNSSEISSNSANSDLYSQAEMRYNRSIKSSKAVQAYVLKNKDIYPEYKGVCMAYKFVNLF